MAGGVNKVIIVGNLGSDPELKYTPSGVAVCEFSVATNESWTDKDSGKKVEKVEWHNIKAWRQLGELCGKYLAKGRQVYIEGKLETRSWDDEKSGTKKYRTEIIARDIQFLGGKDEHGGGNQGGRSTPPSGGGGNVNDDIPF